MHLHIIPRNIAMNLGMKRYYNGTPCVRGHISERKICGSCMDCTKLPEIVAKQKIYQANFHAKNPGLKKQYSDNYYARPEVRIADSEKRKRYRAIHGESVLANQRRYRNERYSSDKHYRAAHVCRRMISRMLAGKTSRSFQMLGYTPAMLVQRMECQFLPGMSWANHGEWHIDHKKPVARFIKQGITDPAIINALSNLQPLWAADNRKKSAKWGH